MIVTAKNLSQPHSFEKPEAPTQSQTMARAASLGLARRFARTVRNLILSAWRAYYVHVWGMDIAASATFSLKANLDHSHPRGIHIGPESYIAFGAAILSHDMTRNLRSDTYVGARCFVGAHSIVLPGVRIGDGSIVGAGSVVTKDVPPRSIVAGNPAVIVRSDIQTYRYGCLVDYLGEGASPPGPADAC